jgi:hypothetical protein
MAINLPPLANGIQLINTGLTPNDRQGDLLPVAFEKINQNFMLAVTKNEDSFIGPITMEQSLTVMGAATFNQQVNLNQIFKANAVSEFRGDAKFFENVTLEKLLTANGVVLFNGEVTFSDEVTFDDPVHFHHTANFEGGVNLPAGAVKPEDLDSMNVPGNDLVLGYNASNGRFAWKVQSGGSGGGGLSSVGLGDIVAAGAGADKFLKINAQGNALVWSTAGSGGITSVDLVDINAAGASPTRVLSVNTANDGLIWVDVAEQQSASFQNLQQMILHHGETARMSGRGIALIQNQSGIRVHNFELPMGIASNLDPELDQPPPMPEPPEPEPLAFVNHTISDAVQNRAFRAELELEGGIAPFYWMLDDDLPEGLDIPTVTSRARNYITGTPTVVGENLVSLRVHDSSEPRRETQVTLDLEVVTPPAALEIVTTELREIKEEVEVSLPIEAVEGTGPYTWSLQAGTLPTGLVLDTDSTTAETTISGFPTQPGVFTVTVRVTDSVAAVSNKTYTLTVMAATIPPLQFVGGTALTKGVIDEAYSHRIVVTGGRAPYYFRIDSIRPPGLYLSSDMDYEPQVHVLGYPEGEPETYTLSIRVMDSSPVPQRITEDFTLTTVYAPSVLELITTSLPGVLTGDQLSIPLISKAGTAAHTWSISAGTLPAGVSLQNSNTGTSALTGYAPSPGNYNFTIRVQDAAGGSQTAAVTLTAAEPPAHHTTAKLADKLPAQKSVVGREYNQSAGSVMSGAITAASTLTSGSLPPGISLNGSLYFTGTPTVAGTYNFRYTNTISTVQYRTVTTYQQRYAWNYGYWNYYPYWPYHAYYWYYPYWGWYTVPVTTTQAYTTTTQQHINGSIKVYPQTYTDTPVSLTSWLPFIVKGQPYSARIDVSGDVTATWGDVQGLPSWMTVQKNTTFLRITGVPPEDISLAQVFHPKVTATVGETSIPMSYVIKVVE